MPYYRFFFTDIAEKIVGHVVMERSDDEHAVQYADKLLAGSGHVGIEVWIGSRRFYRKMKNLDHSS